MLETENKQEDVGLFQDRDLPNGKLNRHRVEVQEGMRREVPGEKSLDSEDHRKEAGEGRGMMEAPGDGNGAGWEARTLNGGKDLWTPGLGRESKLEVVKSGSSYDIRAYKGERKPSRLYGEEEEEEKRYKIPPGDASPGRAHELEEERQEVIRSQAVKRRNTVAEKWGSPGEEAPGAAPSRPAGFALCFDSPSTTGGGRRAPADPEKVVTEQIHFAATRQQFLKLEKANPGVVLWGAPRGPPKMARGVHREEGQGFLSQREAPHSDTPHRGRLGGSPERTERAWQTRSRTSSGQAATCPDTAGGDLASGSGKAPQEAGRSPRDLVAGGPDPTEGTETPIEREIRLGREREEDHRRERGLPRTHSREELVEIPIRSLLLAAAVPSSRLVSSSSGKGKEKPLVSFCIQREVEQDKKREEELRKEGRLPGGPWAEKGTWQEPAQQQQQQQQLQRKVSFEQEVVVVEPPPNGEGPPAPGSPETEGPSGRGAPEPVRPSLDTEAGRGPLGEKEWPLPQPRPPTTTRRPMDPGSPTEEPSATQKFQFSPPGSQEGPDGRQGTSRATAGRPAREELYTLRTWRPRTSALIDREIQEALERERELQEQRRKTGLACPVDSPPFSSQSSVASGVAGSYSVAGSPVFSPTSPPLGRAASGTVGSQGDPRAVQSPSMRRRDDGKYAGIELEDEIDTEVVMSTKAICRRGVLAQMWESGQIRKTEDDGPDGDDDGSLD